MGRLRRWYSIYVYVFGGWMTNGWNPDQMSKEFWSGDVWKKSIAKAEGK